MKQHEIEIGKVYVAKVSDKLTKVRIDDVSPHGGWNATNLATGKAIRIKSPARLRAADDEHRSAPTHKEKGSTGEKMSGLDAAVKVLAEAGTPLTIKQIVERILAQSLWRTKGKTPEATMHSAISKEIKLKGADSRFQKAERGLFTISRASDHF